MASLITKADMYGQKTPNGSRPSEETSAIKATGTNVVEGSNINNAHMWLALVLMLVGIRVFEGMLP